jgi:hypothetical protein
MRLREGDGVNRFARDHETGLLLPRDARAPLGKRLCEYVTTGPAFFSGGGGGSDTLFSSVVLLLNLASEANGATSLVDQSSYGRTTTCGGNSAVTTSAPGGGSAVTFDGTSDSVSCAHAAELEPTNSDFCLEFDLYPNTLAVGRGILGKWDDAGTFTWLVGYGRSDFGSSSARLRLVISTNGSYQGAGDMWCPDLSLTTGAWNSVMVQRRSGAMSWGINGTYSSNTSGYGSTPSSNVTIATNSQPLRIGTINNNTGSVDGYMRYTRFTKAARYTGNYTVSTPFPTS